MPAPDLYLPSNAQTLLAALASALGTEHPAEIVYLDDDTPLPDYVAEGIRKHFPHLAFSLRSDRGAIEEFASLPRPVPDLVRRNVAPGLRGLNRPHHRPPGWLGPRYRTAYIYLSGNFVSKALRRRCDTIVLREEGLPNYHSLRFGPGKALVRMAFGLSPRHQIMGEESWIDRIELNRPEDLPAKLQAKARKMTFPDLMARLPEDVARTLVGIFWEGPPPAPITGGALVLTQPIDAIGFCTASEKRAIYRSIRQRLAEAGFAVVVKRHPRERAEPAEDSDELVIPPFFPIEAWPWLALQKFDLAVALCTAALNSMGGLFSHRQLQLVDPGPFGRKELGNWQARLDDYCRVAGGPGGGEG
ncbi:hypothetical protein [Paracoccus zhejiangensis]|uniref:Uncharacterized protein n=1 Tax=Paracoccus zhejiangensis TaxID=1077935 RepID=A0A2H5F4L2_9RHOB|nr:hypothetical protein [Paracoccus zhejiangensis]AUH66482.1 hypothetical protein CX676_19395 [Paracoccus zhejiangensis]